MRPLKFRRRWWIGHPAHGEGFKAFRMAYRPSRAKQGRIYSYVIGPFKTGKAARWAEKFGWGNPCFNHVDAAERISKQWMEGGTIWTNSSS